MHTELVTVPRAEALKLYHQYKAHVAYSQPIDWEIQRTYQLLSKGRVVIRAIESIRQAGLNREFLPKLALIVATAKQCHLERWRDGHMRMATDRWSQAQKNSLTFREGSFVFPAESFPVAWNGKGYTSRSEHVAQVPIIPVHLRPKRGLANYHILFEAEWQPIPARDPYLLRRIGKSDLWLVVAHWELTQVEMAALATRV